MDITPYLDQPTAIVGTTGAGDGHYVDNRGVPRLRRGSMPTHAKAACLPPTLADKAYAAGFFDGEGCVFIAKSRAKDCRVGFRYSMRIIIGQDDVRPLQFLRDRWGGSLSARHVRANGKRSHNWVAHSKGAAAFLADVKPFLVLKSAQADVANTFQSRLFQPGGVGHTAEYRTELDQLFLELRRLNNQRGEWL